MLRVILPTCPVVGVRDTCLAHLIRRHETTPAELRVHLVAVWISEPVRELITVHRMDEKIMLMRGVSRRR